MDKLFKLRERGVTVKGEFVAGATTFLSMAYILAVNPSILGQIGDGMTPEAVFTATAVAAIVATLWMAFFANLPLALAPGMGLNAFFTFTVVMGMGMPWRVALTAVFLEGVLFMILSFFNVREALVQAIPQNLKKAVAVGIGMFIALIGFRNAGFSAHSVGTIITVGNMTAPGAVTAFIGLIVIFVLFSYKIPGSVLIGIMVATIAGIPLGVTVLPETFVAFSLPAAPLFLEFDFSQVLTLKFFTVFFTFFFVDVFNTVGTLVATTTQAGLANEKTGDFPGLKQALMADAVGTVAGAALGTSTVTTYSESTAGIAAGGRTGLTALFIAGMFVLGLFFSPLFLLVPGAATAPALILVGFLMMRGAVTKIDFSDPTEGIPCFLTIAFMPFTHSVAEGIFYGLLSYCVLKILTKKHKEITTVMWVIFAFFILRIVLM
ncbi:MAG: NCS2 family permease [Spirochaetes bacterium]|nr:NCS2 family permease [Spirochaetota bacterium]